jgi:hypothetical protein
MQIIRKCPICGALSTIDVNKEDYENWQRGELVQFAFPYLTPRERELISFGMCYDCQSRIFFNEDDESLE